MSSKLSAEERKHYREVFDMFDEDHNESIDLQELEKMVNRIQRRAVKKDDLKKMMASVDKDQNGTIDFEEFIELMTQMSPSSDPDNEIKLAFEQIDTDGSGSIDREELQNLFSRLGMVTSEDQIDDVIALVDKDKNGVIDFEEFKEMYEMLGIKDKSPPPNTKKKAVAKSNIAGETGSKKTVVKCCVIS